MLTDRSEFKKTSPTSKKRRDTDKAPEQLYDKVAVSFVKGIERLLGHVSEDTPYTEADKYYTPADKDYTAANKEISNRLIAELNVMLEGEKSDGKDALELEKQMRANLASGLEYYAQNDTLSDRDKHRGEATVSHVYHSALDALKQARKANLELH